MGELERVYYQYPRRGIPKSLYLEIYKALYRNRPKLKDDIDIYEYTILGVEMFGIHNVNKERMSQG